MMLRAAPSLLIDDENDSLDELKQNFSQYMQLWMDDSRHVLGNGTLLTIGFPASDALLNLYQPPQDKQKKAPVIPVATKQLFDRIAECKGELDAKTKTVRIPVDVLLQKLAAVNSYTALKTFTLLLAILKECWTSVVTHVNDLLDSDLLQQNSPERKALHQMGRRWGAELDTLEKSFDLYVKEVSVDRRQLFFPGFDYVRPGEDEAAMVETKSSLVLPPK